MEKDLANGEREGGRDGKDEAWARRFERRLLVNFNHRIQVAFFFSPGFNSPEPE